MKSLSVKLVVPIFSVLLYLYFLLFYNTSLFYHYHQPMFLFSGNFLKEFLVYPGGILDWINLFIFQFFIRNWAGALILTLMVLSAHVLIYRSLKRAGMNQSALIVSILPVGFLLLLVNQYQAPLVVSLRFLTAMLLFTLYSRAGRIKPLFLLISWPLYLLLGGWTFLFYCVLIVLYELTRSSDKLKFLYSALYVLTGGIFPLIAAKFLFLITFREAFTYLYPNEFAFPPFLYQSGPALTGLFIAFPVLLLVFAIFTRCALDRLKRVLPSVRLFKSILIQWICLFIVSGGVLFLSHDGELKTKIAIDRFAQQNEWEKVLETSKNLKAYDLFVNFQVNRALYFQGNLLNGMFSYPQILGTDGLFIHRLIASQVAIPSSDLLYDLGHVSGAQTMAYEGQTKLQYNPRILKRLVMTNLINHEPIAAKKFSDLLKRSLLHRKWVIGIEKRLINPALAEADPEIRAKRALKPTEDFFLNKQHPNMDLSFLLEQHPENQMAFEYLVAYYLLDARLMNLFRFLDQFPRYGYAIPPRHVQEALLVLKTLSPDQVDLDAVRFSPEVLKRFQAFNMIMGQTLSDPKLAEATLKEEFSDTYWFYLRFVSPRQTKVTLKARKIDEI